MRSFLAAAVCDSAVAAGIMASSRGRARLTPAPLSSVRRDRCFFVKNIFDSLLVNSGLHAKGIAGHDTGNDVRQPIVILRGAMHHRPYLWHIEIFEFATEGIHHQLLGQGPVSYTHLRAHETGRNLVCRLLL